MADLLSIGKTGLSASKKSLEVTGHNIANVNTEGYSRQRVLQQTNVPINKGGLIFGTGNRIKNINRVHDPYIEKRLQKSTSEKHFFQQRADQLGLVENVFNEVDNEGLNKLLNKFFNSFRELANQPENETIRSVVRDTANIVVRDFRRIRETMDDIARGADQKLLTEIEDINSLVKNVANLNKKIAALEAGGEETGDLRDQRDLAIRSLSKSFHVETYIDGKNHYVVSAKNVGTLVAGGEYQELAASGTTKADGDSGLDGSVEVFFKSRPSSPLGQKFISGNVASLLKARNEDIKVLREKMDGLAYNFVNTVNSIHRKGFVNRPVELDAAGNPLPFDKRGPVTGINFFKVPNGIDNTALELDLSDEVKSDLSNIVTGFDANSPGDNRIAVAISEVQKERILDDGESTFEESYLQMIGNIGIETSKANFDAEQSEGLLAQANALRERTSGVSIDEETANLVRFQHAYDASAKVMKTANEMFDTVLSIKR
ncbi:MAG: flagellar hook-associated protein FlgK [Bdellovibrio sp. CG12_big_fil_rev_8_21_14_0_65_39_13]|nr:MAG: flagellar hook-associated protein FlgK [Bdellovibrio sp. CG22_combo_CG10-13_8_21_14_all_39_27]PIQ60663.1 MAG: flagellar hook-associated protein FlgK [Bdellovibrio sp. CG12_big_fil_rev_8_21_14_0_65_39_13]PIR37047.1 MAG: flagellar hook-associated protein FlgK [Bdellovibrio sp. CG11_big_fil_rev_8_21_14_0_20_39_38]PJB52428.1 MAG: flagellar hook-associated protein FlgK [Bdellovibrio sp. CG_4_9_14_3_um_filter_39_7]